jgi:hypothetical protein
MNETRQMNETLICSQIAGPKLMVPFFYSGKTKVDYVLEALRLEDDLENISTTAFIIMCLTGILGLGVFALETTLAILAIFARHNS